MNYCQIFDCDIANGPGLRVSLFVSGCTHHCKGCFNAETWDFHYGKAFTEDTLCDVIEKLRQPYITGLTLLGGEPMEPQNRTALLPLLHRVRTELPEKDIWMYSGYVFEDLMRHPDAVEVLRLVDVLVDGKFILEQKSLALKFRGSSNQRILDVPASMECGVPVWVPKYLNA